MNSRWVTLISASLVAFAIIVISCQFLHWDAVDFPSIAESYMLAKHLSKISSYVERNRLATELGPTLNLICQKMRGFSCRI